MTIQYSFDQIQALAEQMGKRVQNLKNHNDDLGQSINRLGGSWEGVTKDNMQASFKKLQGDISDLAHTVYGLMTAVDRGNREMKATEQQLASGWAV